MTTDSKGANFDAGEGLAFVGVFVWFLTILAASISTRGIVFVPKGIVLSGLVVGALFVFAGLGMQVRIGMRSGSDGDARE